MAGSGGSERSDGGATDALGIFADDFARTTGEGSWVSVSGGGTSDGGGEGSRGPGPLSGAGDDSDSVMMTRGYPRLGSLRVDHERSIRRAIV